MYKRQGIPDSIDEDDDNDAIPDYLDDDDDGDGILDFLEEEASSISLPEEATAASEMPLESPEKDTDGDGIPDSIDEDDDNDGIPDYLDDDDDVDSILDILEEGAEDVPVFDQYFAAEKPTSAYPEATYDVFDEIQSVPDVDEDVDLLKDSDGDGIPDYEDDDDDNDGIPDYLDDDDDGDGIADYLEDTGVQSESDMFKYYEIYVENEQPTDDSQLLQSVDIAEPPDDELKSVPVFNESFAPKIEPVFLADNLIHIGIDIDMVSDADGDGIPDYRDDDDDNDCIPDHLDMDTEVQPIALRLVNGPKFKFDGEQNLAVLISRSRQQQEREEQQNTMFFGIFSTAVKSMSLVSDETDDESTRPSRHDDDVSVFTSVFDSFKKSILEEDEEDGEQQADEKHDEKAVDHGADLWPTVTELISSFFTKTGKSKGDTSRRKGR